MSVFVRAYVHIKYIVVGGRHNLRWKYVFWREMNSSFLFLGLGCYWICNSNHRSVVPSFLYMCKYWNYVARETCALCTRENTFNGTRKMPPTFHYRSNTLIYRYMSTKPIRRHERIFFFSHWIKTMSSYVKHTSSVERNTLSYNKLFGKSCFDAVRIFDTVSLASRDTIFLLQCRKYIFSPRFICFQKVRQLHVSR